MSTKNTISDFPGSDSHRCSLKLYSLQSVRFTKTKRHQDLKVAQRSSDGEEKHVPGGTQCMNRLRDSWPVVWHVPLMRVQPHKKSTIITEQIAWPSPTNDSSSLIDHPHDDPQMVSTCPNSWVYPLLDLTWIDSNDEPSSLNCWTLRLRFQSKTWTEMNLYFHMLPAPLRTSPELSETSVAQLEPQTLWCQASE